MNCNFIDGIAALGKLSVESSNRTHDEKEWAKTVIDSVSSFSKLMSTQCKQNITVMGVPIEKIPEIKNLAKQCSVNRVEIFPCPSREKIVPLITVQGGNKELFFQLLGANIIKTNESMGFASELDSLRKQYGVILYENI